MLREEKTLQRISRNKDKEIGEFENRRKSLKKSRPEHSFLPRPPFCWEDRFPKKIQPGGNK